MRQLKSKIAHFLRFNMAKFKFRYLVRYRYYILPFILILITVALTTLAIATPAIHSYLTNGSNSTLVSSGFLAISLSVLLSLGTSMYFWIDYRQHNIPLKQADPKVHYSFKHHLNVVTLPLLRFKWKPLAYALATSTLTILALVGTLYVGIRNVQAATSVSVSINQKSGTADPNPSYTSVFEVVFSEAIDKTTFTSADITLTGSAPGQTVQSITEAGSFNKTTYEVRIAATGSGTITPTISQDLISALNIPTDTNQNSTSTDNTVTYNGTLAPSEFVTTWKTDNPGVSNSNQITIPTTGGGYNYNVDWGDGNTSTGLTGNATHTYSSSGTYTVRITGAFPRIYFNNTGDRRKILTIEQWGTNAWNTMNKAFWGASNLTIPATDVPDLVSVSDMYYMFHSATNLTTSSAINSWNVGNVSNMECAFCAATSFNSPIGNWNVSNVVTMDSMFSQSSSFNQPIGNWDTSNVTRMYNMFAWATSFNQPIGNWDTSNVTIMGNMFYYASAFNQPLNNWNVSNVLSMSNIGGMFEGASAFNQPLNNWDISNVTNLYALFSGAISFDQSLASWDISNVTNLSQMFGSGAGLSTLNYDVTLISWSQQTLQNNITFDAGTSTYCNASTERANIISTHSWTINDAGIGSGCNSAHAPNEFVTTWKTDNPGQSNSDQIKIPTFDGETYNYTVDWGDGNTSTNQTDDAIHIYASPGTYTVSITGTFPRIYFGHSFGDAQKILSVEQWGTGQWTSMQNAFNSAVNLTIESTDNPDLSGVQDTSLMFTGASTINTDINNWNVSNVTNMSGMFYGASSFNQPLNNWNVSNVTNMSGMFYGASSFNQPLNNWDISGADSLQLMFAGASAFNQPLAAWNVSNITNMAGTFAGASAFDQSLAGWNVSNVTDMTDMFGDANGYFVDSSGLSTANYDATIIAWNNLTLQNTVPFDAGTSKYCNAGAQRTSIITTFSWTINDSGLDCTVSYAPNEFVTTWKTDNPGSSASNQITIPTTGGGYNYSVNWGDGNTSTGQTGNATHTYASAGTYTVKITGTFPRIYFNTVSNDRLKILTIEQWGTNPWSSMDSAFAGTSNIAINATDTPDLNNVTNMRYMFANAFISTGSILMLGPASTLNANLNNWDVSHVTNMQGLFLNLPSYNQPLNNWDVSHVTNISNMFYYGNSFNQPLNSWDVSSVTEAYSVFSGAGAFDQPLNNWDVSSVTNMTSMFESATSFNQPLNSWDVSNVTDMGSMFVVTTAFNQPLNSWDVSNVTDMSAMFYLATSFNQPLNNWDVSNVTDMSVMFGAAVDFDRSLEDWDVSNVTTMEQMLGYGSGISVASYDATLVGWSLLTLENNVRLDSSSAYCSAATERSFIISTRSWTINDAGLNCTAVPLTVTLNQATGQDDPTTTNPVNFTAVFSEAIDPSSFTASDIYNSNGNATVGTPTTTDNVTWNIPVTMSRSGTVSVELAAGAVMTVEGTYNETATYTDNSVTYETAQTDFSLTKTLTTPGPIRSGNSVTYHFKITNQGPNDSTYGGAIYDVLPAEFSFSTNSNSSVACMDMGIAEDMGEPYFATFYPGRHLLACMPTVGEVLNTGSSVEFDITGTATTDFTSNVTQNKSIYFDFDNEKAFGDVLEGTLVNNIDFTTLPYNNVSNVTYVYSPNTPNPTPTPTPTPTPNPTPTPTPTSTPKTTTITTPPANGSSPGSPITKNIQYVADRGVLGKRSVGVLPMPLYNFVHQVSDSAAISISWLLLLILLILATFYGWKAYTQYRANQLLITALTRLRNTKQATDTYLQITNHYLNTPVAIMSGAVELLASLNKLPKPSIDHLQSIVAKYKTAVEALAIDGEAAIVDAPTMASTDVQTVPTSYISNLFATVPQSGSALKQRAVYLPLAIVGGIYVLVTFMFANAQVYQLSPVQLGLHLMCLLLSGFLLATTFRQRDLQRVSQQVTQRAIDIEQKLISERTAFIDRASKILSDHYETLSITCRNLGTLPEAKTLLNGLAMLGDTAKSLSNVSRLSHLSTDAPNSKLELDIPKLLMPLQSLASAKQLTLTTHIPPNLSLNIQPEELQQLIQSTVTNAIQFSPTNTTVDVAAQQKGKNILLTITDNGSGIAPEKLDQLFQPFTRGTETETYDHPGLGLNLHVDKLITEKLGGSIQLTSTTAPATTTGTSIIISLPACKSGLRPAPVMIVPGA